MRAADLQSAGWKVRMANPPALSIWQWNVSHLLAVIFVVMAVLQLVSFNDFRNGLGNLGLSAPSLWAAVVILAELWAAAGLFKWRLSYAFRAISMTLALLVAGFWFVLNLQAISNGNGDVTTNSFFFGKFLAQTPGWWTVLEATLLLAAAMYIVDASRNILASHTVTAEVPVGPTKEAKVARIKTKNKTRRSR